MIGRLSGALEKLKLASKRIHAGFDSSTSRTLHLSAFSGAGNAILGAGKIVSGVLGMSVFACVNGLYTLFMALARLSAVHGAAKAGGEGSSREFAFAVGVMLLSASALYLAYAGWSYFHPAYVSYPKYIALAYATFSFTEIGLNIKSLIQLRKSSSAIAKATRAVGMATSVITLALTQEAILSFQGAAHDPTVNAYIRLLTGCIAALIGLYVVVRTRSNAAASTGWR